MHLLSAALGTLHFLKGASAPNQIVTIRLLFHGKIFNVPDKLSTLSHAWNPNTPETEADLIQIWGQPGLQIKLHASQDYSVTLCLKTNNTHIST